MHLNLCSSVKCFKIWQNNFIDHHEHQSSTVIWNLHYWSTWMKFNPCNIIICFCWTLMLRFIPQIHTPPLHSSWYLLLAYYNSNKFSEFVLDFCSWHAKNLYFSLLCLYCVLGCQLSFLWCMHLISRLFRLLQGVLYTQPLLLCVYNFCKVLIMDKLYLVVSYFPQLFMYNMYNGNVRICFTFIYILFYSQMFNH